METLSIAPRVAAGGPNFSRECDPVRLDTLIEDFPERGVLAASRRPATFGPGPEPSGPPAWKDIPGWYLIGTVDNVIPPAQRRAMAQRADATTVGVRAGHLPILSKPDAVAKLIGAAARSAR